MLPVGAQKNKHFLVPQLRTWRFPQLRFVGLIRVHWTHLTLTDKASVGVFLFLYTSNTDDLCVFLAKISIATPSHGFTFIDAQCHSVTCNGEDCHAGFKIIFLRDGKSRGLSLAG